MSDVNPSPGGYGPAVHVAQEYGPGVEMVRYSELGQPANLVSEMGAGVRAVMFEDGTPAHLQAPMGPPPVMMAAMADQAVYIANESERNAWFLLLG